MKFRQKIFLITFIFVTISIDIIGIITIKNNHNKLINSKIEINISNIYNIRDMLNFYEQVELGSSLFNQDGTYYEISKSDNIIYTNLPKVQNNIDQTLEITNNKIKAKIIDRTLYMSLKEDEFKIIIIQNINDIFESRQEQIDFFIKVSIISSFIIAFCLYIIIFLLTRRIDKLDKAVKQIQDGDYYVRVKKLGNDEIGSLGDSLNKMVNSVERNITEIQKISENRKNFIHDITHEIRTPLTSIIGYSSLIKNAKIQDIKTIIEYNNKIYEEGNYLNLISQRLIDIVLLDNQNIKLENTNISQNIKQIVDNMQYNFKDVIFIKNIEDNINLKSDEILLKSLVINIIKNAITACDLKKDKIIEISLNKMEENEVILKIKDNRKRNDRK